MMLSTLVSKFVRPYIDPIKHAIIELRQTADTLKVAAVQQVVVTISETDWTPDVSNAHSINAYLSLPNVTIHAPKSFGQHAQGHVTICMRNSGNSNLDVTFGDGITSSVPSVIIPADHVAIFRLFCTQYKGRDIGTFVTVDSGFVPSSVAAPD